MKTILLLGGAFVSLVLSVVSIFIVAFLGWAMNFDFYYVCFGVGLAGVVISLLIMLSTAVYNRRSEVKKSYTIWLITTYLFLPILVGGSGCWIKFRGTMSRLDNYIYSSYDSGRVFNRFGVLFAYNFFLGERPIIAFDEYGNKYIVLWKVETEREGTEEAARYDKYGEVQDFDMCPYYGVYYSIRVYNTNNTCAYSIDYERMFGYTVNDKSARGYTSVYDGEHDYYFINDLDTVFLKEMKQWLADNNYTWL